MKLTRNDNCWCGSNKKYKKCHLEFDEKITSYQLKGHDVPDHDVIKTPAQIEGIRASANINTAILDFITPQIKEGLSTESIDQLIHQFTLDHGAIPAPLGYQGYPKSSCISLNQVVCHGIPSQDTLLKSGDIVNIDVSTIFNGYYADASRMFMIGDVSPQRQKLVTVAKECLDLGLEAVKPWGFIGDIGAVIQQYAHSQGCSVVTAFGGHGIGLQFHEEPFVPHVGIAGTDMLLVPGMIFTIEPMINAGVPELYVDEKDGWTAYTKDGLDSAQWEYMILVTDNGYEILSY